MQKNSKSLSVLFVTLACIAAILVFMKGPGNLTEIVRPKPSTDVPHLVSMTQMPTITKVLPTPSAVPTLNQLPVETPTARPTLYTLTQQEYDGETWFGRNKFYGNAEDGQSFRVTEVSELQEIVIHLAYRPGGNNERPIQCSLMDSGFNILAETEIPGFQDDGGWKTFRFSPGILLQPGTYIFRVYTQGSYFLRFMNNPEAYSEGQRYTKTWKDTGWEISESDLSFSIFLTKE